MSRPATNASSQRPDPAGPTDRPGGRPMLTPSPLRALLWALVLSAASSGAATAHELPVGDGHVTDHPEAGNVYAYHLTREYPYVLGCFSGELLPGTLDEVHDGLLPSRRRGPRRGTGRH